MVLSLSTIWISMLYRDNFIIGKEQLFVQVHVPRTGGTTLRNQLHEMLMPEQCLMNYRAEIEYLSDAELNRYQLVSGHFSYGMHRYFSRQPLFLTTVRGPIARFVSLYLRLLSFPQNRHYQIASKYDINQFLSYCLQCDDPELSQQVRNLQCQFICGSESFTRAKTFIDERYFLACPFDQSDLLVGMLASLLGLDVPTMRIPNATSGIAAQYKDRIKLTEDSCALLLQHNAQDLQLYHYVQRTFAAIHNAAKTVRHVRTPCPTNSLDTEVALNRDTSHTFSRLDQLMSNASRRFVQCLPMSLLHSVRGLWLGPYDGEALPEGVKFDFVADVGALNQAQFVCGTFDLILVSLAFETLEEDQLLFNRLHQCLSVDGILQISCLNPQRLLDWPDEYPGFSPVRTYQHEVLSHFAIAEKKLLTLILQEKFPLTGARCKVYLFFRSAQYFSLIQQSLSVLRPTLSVSNVVGS